MDHATVGRADFAKDEQNANFLSASATKIADFAKDEQNANFLSASATKIADFAKDEQNAEYVLSADNHNLVLLDLPPMRIDCVWDHYITLDTSDELFKKLLGFERQMIQSYKNQLSCIPTKRGHSLIQKVRSFMSIHKMGMMKIHKGNMILNNFNHREMVNVVVSSHID